jgi:hypothetical protein
MDPAGRLVWALMSRTPAACRARPYFAAAALALRTAAQRFLVAAMMRARPSALRRRFFLAGAAAGFAEDAGETPAILCRRSAMRASISVSLH